MTDPNPRHGMVQSTVQPGAVGGVDPSVAAAPIGADAELAYEAGVELKARSQWSYARTRWIVCETSCPYAPTFWMGAAPTRPGIPLKHSSPP